MAATGRVVNRNWRNTISSLPPSPTTTTLISNTLQPPPTNIEQPPQTKVVEFVDNLSVDYRKVTIPISVTTKLFMYLCGFVYKINASYSKLYVLGLGTLHTRKNAYLCLHRYVYFMK